jgi:small subunit ribosomal protein S16
MVRLRLRKVGSKAQTSFRVVAADREHPRDGRFLEAVGYYNPRTQPATIQLDEAQIYQWLKNGAQPSDSVAQIFKSVGTLARFERFKQGEAVETLLAEASASTAKANPRTSEAVRAANRLTKKQKGGEKKS